MHLAPFSDGGDRDQGRGSPRSCPLLMTGVQLAILHLKAVQGWLGEEELSSSALTRLVS